MASINAEKTGGPGLDPKKLKKVPLGKFQSEGLEAQCTCLGWHGLQRVSRGSHRVSGGSSWAQNTLHSAWSRAREEDNKVRKENRRRRRRRGRESKTRRREGGGHGRCCQKSDPLLQTVGPLHGMQMLVAAYQTYIVNQIRPEVQEVHKRDQFQH